MATRVLCGDTHPDHDTRELDLEIAELLKKAEEADSTPLEDGLNVSGEIARREV